VFFFKNFFRNRKIKGFKKSGDVLKKAYTTKEQRLEAIEHLKNSEAELSVPQLLKRFELVIDHGLQDTKEKDMCMQEILSHKEKSIPFVKECIKIQKRISWPLRISEKLLKKNEYLELLLSNLEPDLIAFDDAHIERNIAILNALKDVYDKNVTEKVLPFLKHRNDDIKIAAVEVLLSQATKNKDELAKKTLTLISKEELNDENSRFLGHTKNLVSQNKWG
jgi:hypothetical protein